MKLVLILLEGQLYLAGVLAIFVGELAFLLWGVLSRRPVIALLAVFVTVPLMRTTIAAIRSCFFRIRAPEGLVLDEFEGRALGVFVEDIRRAVGAPRIDTLTITGGFDASAVAYAERWKLRRRRTLVLGLPVLTTLSTAELRAVIAHELAHFSAAHDGFAAWVYRTRRSWYGLQRSLDRRRATPVYVYWLIRWYVPRLNAASADVSRRHELVADRVAAKVAGSRSAADALVVFEAGERFADETHWPAIEISYHTAAQAPRPYSQMLTWAARVFSNDVLADLFAADTEPGDTHPSLRERFTAFGEPIRMPPALVRSAGEEILGVELEKLASRLDHEWHARHGESWSRQRAQYVDQRTRLDDLSAIKSPTPDEQFEQAELLEVLEGTDEALPIYQLAAEHGHAAASLAAGRIWLDRLEPKGIALIERAIDRDEGLVPEGCRVLAEYYDRTDQELAARKCEWRATRHSTRAHLASQSQP